MLEIDLLYVEHNGRKEAEKLLPFIKNCDIYCPESAARSKTDAEKDEDLWDKIIKRGSNDLFLDYVRRFLNSRNNVKEINDYQIRKYEMLFKYRKPVYKLERHGQRNSQKIPQILSFSDVLLQQALSRLENDRIEEFYKYCSMSYQALRKFGELRELNMLKNIRGLEGHLRKRYPDFKNNREIKVAMDLGHSHQLHIYDLKIPLKVYRLCKETYDSKILKAIAEEETESGFREKLLRFGASCLALEDGLDLSTISLDNQGESEIMDFLKSNNLIKII